MPGMQIYGSTVSMPGERKQSLEPQGRMLLYPSESERGISLDLHKSLRDARFYRIYSNGRKYAPN